MNNSPLADVGRNVEALLDQNDRRAALMDAFDDPEQILDHHRRQPQMGTGRETTNVPSAADKDWALSRGRARRTPWSTTMTDL
jgi:hypothetical protein